MTRHIALIAVLVASSCGNKEESPGKSAGPESAVPAKAGSESAPAEAPMAKLAAEAAPPAVAGAVSPVITDSITFVTPKPGVTWAEMAFPCYRAAIEMDAGGSVTAPFYQVSPMVEPALRAADIDLARGDVAAIGGWDCGGGTCIYLAVSLRKPEKIGDLVAMVAPKASHPEPLHWAFEAPGANGKRNIHIRVVPIQWSGKVPDHAWSKAMAKATHVIFLTGMFGDADADPATWLISGEAAAARVRDAEAVLADRRGRCVVGTTGPSSFKPGFDLASSRFAMAAPPAKGDPLAQVMGTDKSLDVEIELSLAKAPAEADVNRWIAEARQWVSGIAGPVRLQFAAQSEAVAVVFEAASLIATQGFRHELDGKVLHLSWRTDRLRRAELQRLEADLQRVTAKGM